MNDLPLHRRDALRLATALAASGLAPLHAMAQVWPSKAIRFVVPFVPGGSSEIVARAAAAEMTRLLGQSVFVDNKRGAGNVAMAEVARSDDQHTVILGHIGTLAVNPFSSTSFPMTRTEISGRSRCWPRCRACISSTPKCRRRI